MAGLWQDDGRLHKLSQEGDLGKVQDYARSLDKITLAIKLTNRRGPFGYTPFHEAAGNGHTPVLVFLLGLGCGDINARATNGNTPLDVASAGGYADCVRTLLSYGAQIRVPKPKTGNTKAAYDMSADPVIASLLKSEVIVREVLRNGDGLDELLSGDAELQEDCLPRALMLAVDRDDHVSIGKLVLKGASHIDDAFQLAKRTGKHNARALLHLVIAAINNDHNLVLRLFGESMSPEDSGILVGDSHDDEGFGEVQKAVTSGTVSTAVAIEMAFRRQHRLVGEYLLFKKASTSKDGGSVHWEGLHLKEFEVSWLPKIHWAKELYVSNNRFALLPEVLGSYLRNVVRLEAASNAIAAIPGCLLELPSLVHLNLSGNELANLPDLHQWSPSLRVLDLSHNKLTSITGDPTSPRIYTLNLAHNLLRTVPQCICNFVTLRNLDLSYNREIQTLPMQLGRLSGLVALNLKGLSNLQDPPQSVVNDTGSCMRYLKSKLKSARPFYELKLMLLGDAHCGKTTLLTQLVGRNCQNETTCNVSRWEYRVGLGTKFCFTVWDMGSQEGYYASYQCFLTECSMYLLLFNLTDGEEGVRKLEPWLSSLSFRAPWSCVLIVGTHVDRIPIGDRASKANEVLLKANMLAAKFSHRLKIKQTLAVGLNMGVDVLRDTIYRSAEGYKQKNGVLVMGQLVPLSYHKLNSHILGILLKEVRTGSRDTIMYREEFKALIHRLNLSDLQGEDELRAVTSFLTNVGTLQHFDHHNHNLHQLYFLDPQWLWRKVAMMVNVRGVVPYVRDGIMAIRDIPLLLNDEKFPWQHIEQFLTLLDCFDVALVLDNNRIFVPFTLPEVPPPEACEITEVGGEPLYTRYVHFTTTPSHPGFWNRLMSQAMYFIPQVWFALSAAAAAAATSASEGAPVGTKWKEPAVLFVPCEGRFCTEQRLSIAEPSAAKLLYWSTGLFYRDHDVMFKVELEAVKQCVSIATSPSPLGMKMAGQLLDLVVSLMNDWYTEMLQDKECFNQTVLCRECVRLKNTEPYRFDVQKCLTLAATQNKITIDCCYHPDGVTKNHSVPLTDIIPDLLFEDVVTEFHLNYAEINFSDNHLLGTGGFSSVYHGTYRGESVAVKNYVCGDRAFSELRREVMMLQRFHHPCVVRLVGVCIHPSVLLVLEEAPLGSLENVLSKEGGQVHRVVIHRIAAQVAAALKCLHDNSIIFRDLKAANVLLWSLDPGHVCHCKLTDFGLATHLAPIGARGVFGTKGFTAPEVLYVGSRREYSVYNHKADIFSFGILLYQMISCKHPFIDMQPVMINSAIESGERPKLHDVPQSECAYFYLTRLMQCCWHGNPRRRPTTSEIIDKVCLSSMQSVMTIQPVQSKLSLRHACVVLITRAGVPSTSAELWVSCDGIGGTEISIYATNTMIKSSRLTIKDSQAQCICQCGDHVWVASGAGLEYGMIDIFNVTSRELVHSIRMKDHSISCMAFSNSTVYCGTVEGFCLAFRSDIGQVKSRTEPSCCKYICGDAVDGVLAARDCLWLSHTHQISLHSLSTLAVEGAFGRSSNQRQFVGQLKMSADGAIIWSFQLGGFYVSAWSSTQKCHIFDIDVRTHMRGICQCQERDMIITAMAPALDTVWVGLATGHILVFRVELLMWFHPYMDYVRFLVCMPSDVHYAAKKTVMVSGAKEFRSPFIPNLPDYETVGGNGIAVDKAGVLVMWEAFPSRMCQQISLLQSHSSTFLDSHDSVKEVIKKGSFNDGALGNDMFSTREVNGACSGLKVGTEVLSPFVVLEHAVSEESKREQDLVRKEVMAEVKTEVMAELEVKTELEVKAGQDQPIS